MVDATPTGRVGVAIGCGPKRNGAYRGALEPCTMSDTPQSSDWWLASDGKWYPPESRPGQPLPPPPAFSQASGAITPPAPHGAGSALRIGGWAQGLMWASAGMSAAVAVSLLIFRGKWEQWDQGIISDSELVSSEENWTGWNSGAVLVGITAFVLLVIWLVQAQRETSRLLPQGVSHRYSTGWCIGAWFIPIANFILVPKVFAEHQRIADAPRTGRTVSGEWRSIPLRPTLVWWWVLNFIGLAMAFVGTSNYQESLTLSGTMDGLALAAAGQVATAIGLASGAVFIRDVSSKLKA